MLAHHLPKNALLLGFSFFLGLAFEGFLEERLSRRAASERSL